MKDNLAAWLFIYLLGLICHLPEAYAASQSQTYTLEDITKVKTVVLEGRTPSYSLYLPLNPQWQVDEIRLQLDVRYSEILRSTSSVTVLVNNTPLDTLPLNKAGTQLRSWDITIPQSMMKHASDIITISLVAYLNVSDDVCADLENKGNWVTIAGSSRVTYDYQYRDAVFALKDFPQPFINQQALAADKISLLLPATLSLEHFAPYLKVAHTLAQKAGWRGVDFELVAFEDFDRLPNTPSILIGTADTFDFNPLSKSIPLRYEQRQWMQDDGSPLADDTGFIALIPHTKNPASVLMVVSANQPAGLENVLDNLSYGALSSQAVLPDFYMASAPEKQMPLNSTTSMVTLSHLGYQDRVVYGDGQGILSYQFHIDDNHAGAPLELVLEYSHSPFLSGSEPSYMSVIINHIPLDGVFLSPGEAQKSQVKMVIPATQLQLGKNQLEVKFDLHLQNKTCSRYQLGYAWGTVYGNSYLTFGQAQRRSEMPLKAYPYIMNGQVLLGLPAENRFYQDKEVQQQLLQLVSSLQESKTLSIVANHTLPEAAKDYNLIFLGTHLDNMALAKHLASLFSTLVNHLVITSNKVFQSIDQSLFEHAFERDQQVGFIGMFPSPVHANRAAMVLYGHNKKDLLLTLALINDAYKRNSLSANLAVAFENGSYTALSTEDIHQQVTAEIQQKLAAERSLRMALWIGLGIGLFVLTLIGLRMLRRK
ncbi:MAG: cellulose biosynthesis cyclic di-GMP-binding regulatory protein BcsB [Legionellaceae bacterium]|nr:cellulose biosynthesis cyclic di-GMP-binding regulatory protein BcsB [Legionellaceae bacterium]